MKKYFTLLFLMINSFVFGQNITLKQAKQQVGDCETIVMSSTVGWCGTGTEEEVLRFIEKYAKDNYRGRKIIIRDFIYNWYSIYNGDMRHRATLVEITDYACYMEQYFNKAFDKVLMNVREGSRFSIDKVTVTGEIANEVNKETVTDNTIDILLDKGYKVVAKEYLERLYQEQQAQQSGIYNENTIVQENNLSAVGYFLNIKITDESLRVQVINVSTGEYEGNATITF